MTITVAAHLSLSDVPARKFRPRNNARIMQVRILTRDLRRDPLRALRRFLRSICPSLSPSLKFQFPHARHAHPSPGRTRICRRGFRRTRRFRSSLRSHLHQRRKLFPMQVSTVLSFSPLPSSSPFRDCALDELPCQLSQGPQRQLLHRSVVGWLL